MADANVNVSRMMTRLALGGSEGGSAAVVLDSDTTQRSTGANQTETDLFSYAMPANMLSYDGAMARVKATASCGGTANVKTFRLYVGGTLVQTVSTSSNGGIVQYETDVHRVSATSQRVVSQAGASTAIAHTVANPTETLSGAVTIRLTGQNDAAAAAGDHVGQAWVVELLN
jgi:hypothetical protein